METKKLFRLTTTVLMILVLGAIILYPKFKQAPASQGNQQQGTMPGAGRATQSLFASGYILKPTEMSELRRAVGSLLPDEEVELSFETSGKIVEIYFEEGTRVKKGELLAKINDRPLQAQLLKLQAQIKLSEEKEYRQRQLLDRDAISRESYDQVYTELQSLQADIQLIEARIAETELRAPFNGTVGLRMISEGAFATTQTKIVRLVKLSPLKIEFSIPERYAGEITPGFPVTFLVDGFTEEFKATVYAIEPKIQLETRTIMVRAMYPNRNEELKPGRFANVMVKLSQIENTVSIPSEAIIPEIDGEKVFIYSNGRAEQKTVVTGLRTESHIQIKEGVNFGDTLLITATLQLRQSLPIQLDTLITNEDIIL